MTHNPIRQKKLPSGLRAILPPSDSDLAFSRSDLIPIGWSVRLASVRSLSRELGTTDPETFALLRKLKVPVIGPKGPISTAKNLPPVVWFNVPTLELALYSILRLPDDEKPISKSYLRHIPEMEDVARRYYHFTRESMKARLGKVGGILRQCRGRYEASRRRKEPADGG